MSVEVSVDSAKKNLEGILARLSPGETATLIGPKGNPMAVLVSLKSSEDAPIEIDWDADWDAEWQSLAREIDSSWKSKKSVLEILTEMRR